MEVDLNYLKGELKPCQGMGTPTAKNSDFMVWSPHDHQTNEFKHDTCFNGAIQQHVVLNPFSSCLLTPSRQELSSASTFHAFPSVTSP